MEAKLLGGSGFGVASYVSISAYLSYSGNFSLAISCYFPNLLLVSIGLSKSGAMLCRGAGVGLPGFVPPSSLFDFQLPIQRRTPELIPPEEQGGMICGRGV